MLPYIIDGSTLPDGLDFVFSSITRRNITEHPIESVLVNDILTLVGKNKDVIDIEESSKISDSNGKSNETVSIYNVDKIKEKRGNFLKIYQKKLTILIIGILGCMAIIGCLSFIFKENRHNPRLIPTSSSEPNIPPANIKKIVVQGVTFNMIKIEGGTFQMGATLEQGDDVSSDERPIHSVTLADYYIGQTEVTQELWEAVMGSNPSAFKGENKPVENVSWNYCQSFIRKLSTKTHLTFRLPTEAEWKYASRGGKQVHGQLKFSGSNKIAEVAWFNGNSGGTTHEVKSKKFNGLGLFDMSGNVSEWCSDYYYVYKDSSQASPHFEEVNPSNSRVIRGGCWNQDESECRTSFRDDGNPNWTRNRIEDRFMKRNLIRQLV